MIFLVLLQAGCGGSAGEARIPPHAANLRQAFTLHVGLDPLQPVGVLLLPHPFVHLGTQLFRLLQGVLQVAMVGVVFRSVFQDLHGSTESNNLLGFAVLDGQAQKRQSTAQTFPE